MIVFALDRREVDGEIHCARPRPRWRSRSRPSSARVLVGDRPGRGGVRITARSGLDRVTVKFSLFSSSVSFGDRHGHVRRSRPAGTVDGAARGSCSPARPRPYRCSSPSRRPRRRRARRSAKRRRSPCPRPRRRSRWRCSTPANRSAAADPTIAATHTIRTAATPSRLTALPFMLSLPPKPDDSVRRCSTNVLPKEGNARERYDDRARQPPRSFLPTERTPTCGLLHLFTECQGQGACSGDETEVRKRVDAPLGGAVGG